MPCPPKSYLNGIEYRIITCQPYSSPLVSDIEAESINRDLNYSTENQGKGSQDPSEKQPETSITRLQCCTVPLTIHPSTPPPTLSFSHLVRGGESVSRSKGHFKRQRPPRWHRKQRACIVGHTPHRQKAVWCLAQLWLLCFFSVLFTITG